MGKKKILLSLVSLICIMSVLIFILYPKSLMEKYQKISIGDNEAKVLKIMGDPWNTISCITDAGEVTEGYTHYWLKPTYSFIISYPFYKVEYSEIGSVNMTFKGNIVVEKYKEP